MVRAYDYHKISNTLADMVACSWLGCTRIFTKAVSQIRMVGYFMYSRCYSHSKRLFMAIVSRIGGYKMKNFEIATIDAFCDLPAKVREKWQFEACLKQMERGENPDPSAYWLSLSVEQQWETVAALSNIAATKTNEKTNESNTLYNWSNIADEAVGFLICGNSGSAKSSLATWLAGHLTQNQPMAVIALDPHFNDCWKLSGIKSIGKIQQIEATLMWLLEELDARCDRKGDGLPLGDPMFIICDELNAALERFENPKVINSTLKRLGSEGRKFGLNFCGLNQSSNAEALGIDAKYRSNYALILLGQSARTHAKLGKYLTDVAYPCIVTGSIADAIAIHPTHGNYQFFKKQGNPPMNLQKINQLPLPDELTKLLTVDKLTIDNLSINELTRIDSPKTLKLANPTPVNLSILATIFDYAKKQNDFVTASQVKANIRILRDTSTSEIRNYFQNLADSDHGIVRGDPNNLEFSAQ